MQLIYIKCKEFRYLNFITPNIDINILHKKNEKVSTDYKVNINKIKTPLNKGDIVGNISIGNRLEYIYIASDVKKANIFELYIKYLKNMFSL